MRTTLLLLLLTTSCTALLVPARQWQANAAAAAAQPTSGDGGGVPSSQSSSSSSLSSSSEAASSQFDRDIEQNSVFLRSLISNLGRLCDKYIMNGSPMVRERIFNLLDQIEAEAVIPENESYIRQALRTVKRAGVPMHKTYLERFQQYSDEGQDKNGISSSSSKELGKTDPSQRRQDAQNRQQWEQQQRQQSNMGKSALSRRMGAATNYNNNGGRRPDVFLPSVLNPDDIATIARDKESLQNAMEEGGDNRTTDDRTSTAAAAIPSAVSAGRISQMIARAGSGHSFEGDNLGIGGLDDVLVEIKRRIWTPLAAPPSLLKELGIHPVRGLLLYGKPGCGKTLLASTIGSLLSPFRPITVVSGPEVMDKFVGSSEKNLREIFDNPPDIYDTYRINEADGGDSIASHALHVVVMDEFDAIARSRGGQDGKGGQGDAGVARDSVVNQLLAKMDGVAPLPVPTLVIGLTNKRSLIEPALLRPGRFEVQIEIPPPRTVAQRVSILKVHTKSMYDAGRLEVADPPNDTAAARHLFNGGSNDLLLPYEDLLIKLAVECDGFSGASLAAVARAAASHALERAVEKFSTQLEDSSGNGDFVAPFDSPSSIMDCLVTQDDFDEAIQDVRNSMGTHDYTDVDETIESPEDIEEDDDDDPVQP
jgi:ATP-dependent 26S proteasome regulatory subunit